MKYDILTFVVNAVCVLHVRYANCQGWARDVKARDQDETETLTSRDRDETFVALET